jgi:hypothetical protein
VDTTAFDTIAAPGYLGDLTTRPLAEIRTMRAACLQLEEDVSYLRRLVQGRVDIVEAEVHRRAQGDPGGLAGLLEALPVALGSHLASDDRRDVPHGLPGADDAAVVDELDRSLDTASVARVPELSDDELADMGERLRNLERDVSDRRRVVFERLDALTAELTRRYRSGEAAVEPPTP